jgi:hypothetical protein
MLKRINDESASQGTMNGLCQPTSNLEQIQEQAMVDRVSPWTISHHTMIPTMTTPRQVPSADEQAGTMVPTRNLAMVD